MVMRISGLSSGMDIDSMVKQLMDAQRVPLTKLQQKVTKLQWQRSDYTTMYNSIKDFKTQVADYKLQKTVSAQKVASTNEAVATATANGAAATVNHTLSVKKLAEGANITSTDKLGSTTDKTSLTAQFAGNASLPAADFTLKINGKDITVKVGESINQLVSNINNSGAGVKAVYDTNADRLFISTDTTGAAAAIDFTGTDATGQAFLKDVLKMPTNPDASLKLSTTGQDAEFILDGTTLTQSKNTFTIADVTYTLKSANETTPVTTTVSVSADVDKIVENVKAFVDSYNKLLAQSYSELTESKYRDYTPLTSDQKKEMSEDDIKLWEEKAKSGALRSDGTLRQMVDSMRSSVYSPVAGISGKYTSLSTIGITTGSYLENGKLYINETKLRQVLADDPEAVSKLFATDGADSSHQGIARRLDSTFDTAIKAIDKKAGVASGAADTESVMAKQLKDYNKQITALQTRLTDMETRYYTQFTAMETALQKMNSQSSWLTQQLSS